MVDAIHNNQLREHGGFAGIRDENVLEFALARPKQKWHYGPLTDLPMLAAAYAFGPVSNHAYRDGNKRIGFLAMLTFLGVNGLDFSVTEAEVVSEFLALADGPVSEKSLTEWVRQYRQLVADGGLWIFSPASVPYTWSVDRQGRSQQAGSRSRLTALLLLAKASSSRVLS